MIVLKVVSCLLYYLFKMVGWNKELLLEICLEVINEEDKLQRFALTGKETFLTYVEIFRSVQDCTVQSSFAAPTLVNVLIYKYIVNY